jgi:hypothetical protein
MADGHPDRAVTPEKFIAARKRYLTGFSDEPPF